MELGNTTRRSGSRATIQIQVSPVGVAGRAFDRLESWPCFCFSQGNAECKPDWTGTHSAVVVMKTLTISIAKKVEPARQPSFSFRRIAGRELYQPAQTVEPEGRRVYYRTRRHMTNFAS